MADVRRPAYWLNNQWAGAKRLAYSLIEQYCVLHR